MAGIVEGAGRKAKTYHAGADGERFPVAIHVLSSKAIMRAIE